MLQEHISPYWQTLIGRLTIAQSTEAAEGLSSLQRQIQASSKEQIILPNETDDPLGAHSYQVGGSATGGRLIHQYKNRCLFLVVGQCFAHCRYCFRKEDPALSLPFACESEILAMCAYISKHREVQEIILTGGDPLTVSDTRLEALFVQLRQVRPDILIRLATRAPIFSPNRITSELIQLLRRFKPLWIIPHINHPIEISQSFAYEARHAVESLINAGIPMQSQTVLLRGINDNVQTLSSLFYDLVCIGIRPGYLFQGDMASGTSHFRIPLKAGISLYKKLRTELSGLSTPIYAVDLPNGGGKVDILQMTDAQKKLLKKLYTK